MREPGLQRFAGDWAASIAGTSYVSMSVREVTETLGAFTDRMVRALFAEPFDVAPAREVGRALVAAHFTGPDTLGRTVAVLPTLVPLLGVGSEELHGRVVALQGALAAGYAQALRDRTLDEQEAIRTAELTARRETEGALRNSEARFRAVFAGAAIAIWICDVDARVLEANRAFVDLLGLGLPELRGRPATDLLHPDDVDGVAELHAQLVAGKRGSVRAERRFLREDGGVVWVDFAKSLVRDDEGRPSYVVAVGQDVSDRRRLQTRLRHEALYDPLTGLPNRSLFSERLARTFADPAPDARVGLCFLDIDDFRTVNDRLGHDVGDKLLVAVSDLLDRGVTEERHLLARTGGDEFVVLVTGSSSADDVVGAGQAALGALTERIEVAGHDLTVTASAGIVERPVSRTNPADLMRAADIALSWAKADGKNRWRLFEPERNAREVARYTLSATMPAALERQEFTVDYQPLVRLADGSVLGVEALVRWRNPLFGLLTPDQFLGLAEENGMIVPLGRWVLEQACRQARRWHRGTLPEPFVSVNLAVQQASDPVLVRDIASILDAAGLPPDRLQLELSEDALLGMDSQPLSALRALAVSGVRVAIDHFGTSYANLSDLRKLPVRDLKLASTFVEPLRTPGEPDPVDEQVLATLVDLAHKLGMTVTAEGVEDALQAERLLSLGCDGGQGWFFAPPGPPDQIARLLTAPPAAPPSSG